MIDLNSLLHANSGWTLFEANAVNDRGQIVGTGRLDGQTRAFMMTVVPEPVSSLLMLPGGGVMFIIR